MEFGGVGSFRLPFGVGLQKTLRRPCARGSIAKADQRVFGIKRACPPMRDQCLAHNCAILVAVPLATANNMCPRPVSR